MNPKMSFAILAAVMATMPVVTSADPQSDMVMQQSAQVMSFDQNQAMHMFLPDSTGGVLEVVVHDMDPHQIALVRSHLLEEAAKFARGDYADPAYIHGKTMPGLTQMAAGASRVSVRYFETPTGAAITFSSSDTGMVSAIHQWLAAQQRDHGSMDMKHCDMPM